MVRSRFIIQRFDVGQRYLHPISFPIISFFPNFDAGNEATMLHLRAKPGNCSYFRNGVAAFIFICHDDA